MKADSPFLVKRDVRDGIIGEWNLGNELSSPAIDQSVNSNNGAITNGSRVTDSILGSKKVLELADGFVDCGNNSSLNFGNNYSLSILFRIDAITLGTTNVIFSKYDTTTPLRSILIYQYSNSAKVSLTFSADGTNYIQIATSNDVLEINKWYHLVLVLGTPVLYLNNESIALDGVYSGTPFISSANFKIGGRDNFAQYFNGAFGPVRLYDRPLTVDDVDLLYKHYQRRFGVLDWL